MIICQVAVRIQLRLKDAFELFVAWSPLLFYSTCFIATVLPRVSNQL